jgi:hypothetical protein
LKTASGRFFNREHCFGGRALPPLKINQSMAWRLSNYLQLIERAEKNGVRISEKKKILLGLMMRRMCYYFNIICGWRCPWKLPASLALCVETA